MPKTYRNDTAYVKRREALRRHAKRNDSPCHLCGLSIEWDVEWKHPMSFTADHVEAVAAGGRMLGELRPAHRSCNSKRGKKTLDDFLGQQEARKVARPRTTRSWY